MYFFDLPRLQCYLDAAGFDILTHRYVSITVTMGFAAQRLGALLGSPRLGRLPGFLARRSVPINPLYDLMIVARRVDSA